MIDEEGRVWPDNPHKHLMTPPKKRKDLDYSYKYEKKNPFYKLWSFFLRILALIFIPIINHYAYRFKITGKKNLRKLRKTGFVAVSNHVLHMDAAIIASSIFNTRKCYFIMLGENSTIPVAGSILRSLGGVPIASDTSGTMKFLNYCNKLIKKKKPILIFPEVAMWHGYKGIRPFEGGGFRLATSNNVPVLPIVITLKYRNKKKTRYKAYFKICDPIYPNTKLKGKLSAMELTERTHDVFVKENQNFYKNERKKHLLKVVKKSVKQQKRRKNLQ